MKLNKKQTTFLLIIALTVIFLIAYFVFNKIKSTTTPTPTTVTFPTPYIPNDISQKPSIEIKITKKDFNFPDKLPYLTQENNSILNDSQAFQIAKNLGFNEDPIKTKDIQNGTIYIWNSKTNFLTITPFLKKIKYGPNYLTYPVIKNAPNKILSDQELENIALNFITQTFSINKENLKYVGLIYLKTAEGIELYQQTQKSNAEIFQLNFFSSDSDYPIYNLNPQQTSIYVQILKDGTILNMEATLLNRLVKGETFYKLKTYDEFIENKDSSILISLSEGNINLPDLSKNQIQTIVINKVELVYLIDKISVNLFQPTFLLSGTATLSGYSNPVSAFLYLPAFSLIH